jgi:hypothetical protein
LTAGEARRTLFSMMKKKTTKKPKRLDVNQLAAEVLRKATAEKKRIRYASPMKSKVS